MPTVSARQRNADIYAELIAGDDSAVNWLIEANMPLVRHIVNQSAARSAEAARIKDDLTSVGMLALTEAVNAMRPCNHDSEPGDVIENVTNYLSSAIRTAISHAIQEEPLVGPEQSTQWHNRRKGQEFKASREALDEASLDAADDDSADLLSAILDTCCRTTQERDIIVRRAAGASDVEIAEAMGINASTVCRARQRVEARYFKIAL